MLEDTTLVKLCQEGSEEAFEKLLIKYRPFILSAISEQAMIYFQGLDQEDLYQECVLVLYKAVNSYTFNTNATFYTYYKKSLKNLFSQLYRKFSTDKRKAFLCSSTEEKYQGVIDNYEGIQYSSTLTPESICVLKESFEQAYKILTAQEKDVLHDTINTTEIVSERNKRIYYNCKSKIKKTLRKVCR